MTIDFFEVSENLQFIDNLKICIAYFLGTLSNNCKSISRKEILLFTADCF